MTKRKKGYSKHPETLRWKGKLLALYKRHEKLVKERTNFTKICTVWKFDRISNTMKKRGYKHNSDLDFLLANGGAVQKIFVDTPDNQKRILKRKNAIAKSKSILVPSRSSQFSLLQNQAAPSHVLQ